MVEEGNNFLKINVFMPFNRFYKLVYNCLLSLLIQQNQLNYTFYNLI